MDNIQELTLAALLYDIKNVWHRTEFAAYIPTGYEELVGIAARLVPEQSKEQISLPSNGLLSALARVDLGETLGQGEYEPRELSGDYVVSKPKGAVNTEEYDKLWRTFHETLERYHISGDAHIATWLALLYRFTSLVPAVPNGKTDISLYDRARVTAAIATCLFKMAPDERDTPLSPNAPLALLVRVDFTGIQNFIYRITEPSGETEAGGQKKGTAKRLRGRSFYVSLLNDVVADWFIRKLGLSPANILFCGGGKFDLLVPWRDKERVTEIQQELEKSLLQEFHGEVSVLMVDAEVTSPDFADLRRVYNDLEDKLALAKQRKFLSRIGTDEFHLDQTPKYHACRICQLTPMDEQGECKVCQRHKEIGGKLPRTTYIAYVYGKIWLELSGDVVFMSFPSPIDTRVLLLSDAETVQLMRTAHERGIEVALYKLNDPDCLRADAPPNGAMSFRFMANEAAREKGETDVLDFAEIAALNKGAQLLGVLKADVDHLGLLFSEGLAPMTISRVATLSRELEWFFSVGINHFCNKVTHRWQKRTKRYDVKQIFYVVYAGGDDLFVLGPWEPIGELALELDKRFREYAGNNQNVTISAGVLLVKPHFPIQRFAELVEEELEKAKNQGRKRITIFGVTVTWYQGDNVETGAFGKLWGQGQRWARWVEQKKMPKGFVYYLLRLHKQHFIGGRDEREIEEKSCIWLPKLYYMARRRLRKEVINKLDLKRFVVEKLMKFVRIPVSIVSLKTRKERK